MKLGVSLSLTKIANSLCIVGVFLGGMFPSGCMGLFSCTTTECELNQGLESYRYGQYRTAEALFTRVLSKEPKNVKALEYRSYARDELGKDAAALADINRAIELNPRDGDLYFARGFRRLNLGRDRGAIEDWQKAVDKGISRNRTTQAYYNQGVTLSELGDTDLAIEKYKSSLESDSTFWRAHNDLTDLLKAKWKFDEAAYHATRMMELTKGLNKIKALRKRSQLHSIKGEFKKALRDLNQLLKQRSNDIRAQYNRAIVLYKLDRYERSLAELTEVYSEVPLRYEPYALKALLLAELGEPQRALSILNNKIDEMTETRPKAGWYARSRVHFKLGNLDQALEDVNRAIELIPKSPDRYQTLAKAFHLKGRILKGLGHHNGAKKAVDRAIEINPNNASFQRFKEKLNASLRSGRFDRVKVS